MSNSSEIGSAITDAISNEELGVIVELADVSYIDSAGIRLIFHLSESLRARGQWLLLVIPAGSPVSDSLRLAGIQNRVSAVGTVDEALAGLPASETAAPS